MASVPEVELVYPPKFSAGAAQFNPRAGSQLGVPTMYECIAYEDLAAAVGVSISAPHLKALFGDGFVVNLALDVTQALYNCAANAFASDVRVHADGTFGKLFTNVILRKQHVVLRACVDVSLGAAAVVACQADVLRSTQAFVGVCEEYRDRDVFGSLIHCAFLRTHFGDKFHMPRYAWVPPKLLAEAPSVPLSAIMDSITTAATANDVSSPKAFCGLLGLVTRQDVTEYLVCVARKISEATTTTTEGAAEGTAEGGAPPTEHAAPDFGTMLMQALSGGGMADLLDSIVGADNEEDEDGADGEEGEDGGDDASTDSASEDGITVT